MLIKSNKKRVKIIFSIISVLLISSFLFGCFLLYKLVSPNNYRKANANNLVSFNDGQISIQKRYLVGTNEEPSTVTVGNDILTVRLKYNNTSSSILTQAVILDTIPSQFSFVAGSLRNCYVDMSCVTLNNNLVAGSNLTVAPQAGYFGSATDNTLTSSNLHFGRDPTLTNWDSTRGYGYIQYQMQANVSIATGFYGTEVFLNSPNLSQNISYDGRFSISVEIICETIQPASIQRNVGLADSELLTGQDFTCVINPKICPEVFTDIDLDGTRNGTETLAIGIQLQLLSEDENTIYSTMTTTGNANQCFTSITSNQVYKVRVVNPISTVSTTGGNTKLVVISGDTVISPTFGYNNGILSLEVPPTVNFNSVSVLPTEQNTTTDIEPIKVTDGRLNHTGWDLSCQVDSNFTKQENANISIPIANRLKMTPTVLTSTNGTTGILAGQVRDKNFGLNEVFLLSSSESGYGAGETTVKNNLDFLVPAYSPAGNFQTVISCTLV